MNLKSLLVSNLNISEDNYSYKGIFTLSGGNISMSVDLADLDNSSNIQEIKTRFELQESNEDIRNTIMSKVMLQAVISSHISEGEDFQEEKSKAADKPAGSLDRA